MLGRNNKKNTLTFMFITISDGTNTDEEKSRPQKLVKYSSSI